MYWADAGDGSSSGQGSIMIDRKERAMRFTPRLADGTRLDLDISAEDMGRVMGRDLRTRGVCTDITTGQRYRIKGAACGLPRCYCDAVATPVKA